jgi:hypothetical protein
VPNSIRRRARLVAAATGTLVALGAGLLHQPARASDFSDPAYLEHDLENVQRSLGPGSRQLSTALDPAMVETLAVDGTAAWISNLATQVAGVPSGRAYVSLGQLLPGATVGDPATFGAIVPTEVDFASRTGALLHGRVWWDGQPGRHPAIVITSGSIQSPAVGYHWAAQLLAASGYVVLTWDPQGQGESETFGHAPGDVVPTADGVPFQQEANFVDGTVDALLYLLSTPTSGYVPGGWTAADAATHRASAAGAGLSWTNPLWSVVDTARVGLAGHSLGADAVSIVAQCSDRSTRWQAVPACLGHSFPIRAVVGWDRLQAGGDVVPVVPGMDQEADGYFLNPQPSPQSPDPSAHLAAHDAYVAAGVDTYALTVRGGTHCEWSWIPAVCAATGYGQATAGYYTLAWFDRYLHPSTQRQISGGTRLLAGPVPDGRTGGVDQLPWRADFLSVRYRSAFSCRCMPGDTRRSTADIRAFAGLSPVGDWAAANADRPAVRPVS